MVVDDRAVGREVEHPELLVRVGALRHHDAIGERVDVLESRVGAVRRARASSARRPGVASGVHVQPEVLGAVRVREHEEPLAGRAVVVLDVVLVALLARFDDGGARAVGSSASSSRTSVVIFDADVITSTRPLRDRSTDTK